MRREKRIMVLRSYDVRLSVSVCLSDHFAMTYTIHSRMSGELRWQVQYRY